LDIGYWILDIEHRPSTFIVIKPKLVLAMAFLAKQLFLKTVIIDQIKIVR